MDRLRRFLQRHACGKQPQDRARALSAGVSAVALSLPLGGHAFELGSLRLEPTGGTARTGLISIKGNADPAQMMAWVVSPEGYRAAGLDPKNPGHAIRITPFRVAGGEVRLRLDGVPVVPGGYDLLVIVADDSGSRVGRYRLDASSGLAEIPVVSLSRDRLVRGDARRDLSGTGGSGPAGAPAQAHAASQLQVDVARPGGDGADRLEKARAAVEAWRQAWSQRDVQAYLAAYAPDYAGRVPGRSRDEWVRERTQRLQARRNISVEVQGLQWRDRGDTVFAIFRQVYRADGVVEVSRKRLTLAPVLEGRWLIVAEEDRP
jgi:ketosteroid isomerase-like protein